MKHEPFFIIGAQRSGTTLVRLLLNAHSKIAIPEEGTFWMPIIREYGNKPHKDISKKILKTYISYIKNNAQFKTWHVDEKFLDRDCGKENKTISEFMACIYKYYASTNGAIIWGDKTPSFFRMVSRINNIFPQARFIHVYRDGRDTFLSLRKKECDRNNVVTEAIEWVFKIRIANKQLNKINKNRVFLISYENLIASPENTLSELCAFLGVKYEESMLLFWQQSENYIGRHHSDKIFQPITSDSIGKWKHEFNDNENALFDLIAGSTLEQLNYKRTEKAYNRAYAVFIALFYSLTYLPKRIFRIVRTYLALKYAAAMGVHTNAAGGASSHEK